MRLCKIAIAAIIFSGVASAETFDSHKAAVCATFTALTRQGQKFNDTMNLAKAHHAAAAVRAESTVYMHKLKRVQDQLGQKGMTDTLIGDGVRACLSLGV